MITYCESTDECKKYPNIETLDLAKKRERQIKKLHQNWVTEIIGDSSPFTVIARPQNDNNFINNRTMSEEGKNLLSDVEGGFRLKPYNDQTGDCINEWIRHATIGCGHIIKEDEWIKFKDGVSKNAAIELFKCDLERFVTKIDDLVKRETTKNQFDALVMLGFNIGIGALQESSVMRMINDLDSIVNPEKLEEAWKKFKISNHKVMPGLIKRRQCELNVYFHNSYKNW